MWSKRKCPLPQKNREGSWTESCQKKRKIKALSWSESQIYICSQYLFLTFHPGSVRRIRRPFGQSVLFSDRWMVFSENTWEKRFRKPWNNSVYNRLFPYFSSDVALNVLEDQYRNALWLYICITWHRPVDRGAASPDHSDWRRKEGQCYTKKTGSKIRICQTEWKVTGDVCYNKWAHYQFNWKEIISTKKRSLFLHLPPGVTNDSISPSSSMIHLR